MRLRCLFVSLALGARALAAEPPPPVALPPDLTEVGVDEHLGTSLPLDVKLRDHTGATVALGSLFDGKRPVVVNLMYHRCSMLCGVVLDSMADALKGIPWTVGKEFDVITISIDPRDTPDVASRKRDEVLARYGRPEAAIGWHFLTGEEKGLARIADAIGFRSRYLPTEDQYAHPAAIFIVTPDGKLARYLYGVEYAPTDVRFGLLEAAAGRSVSTLEKLMLFCYHYDATGRRYTFLVTRVLRLGGAVLLLLVGGLVAGLWMRERRHARVAT